MLTIETIRNVLNGTDLMLTDDEQTVVTACCHLTALQICDMASIEERRAAVAGLPENLAEQIKAEVVQEFNRRKAATA